MKSFKFRGIRPLSLSLAAATLFATQLPSTVRADDLTLGGSATNAAPAAPSAPDATAAPAQEPVDPTMLKLRDAYQHLRKGELDAAIAEAGDILKSDPKNQTALLLRGSIYANQKNWTQAQADYDAALANNPSSSIIKFDQSELKFLQKDYAGSRSGFQALVKDPDLGDLAAYKVFLSDLFSGNNDAAQKELDAFNNEGGNPSYYFANAAWDLVHTKNNDDAISWLNSAQRIYADAPQKLVNYSSSLRSLGYLPVKPSTPAPGQ